MIVDVEEPAAVFWSPIAEAVMVTVPLEIIVAVEPEMDNTEGLLLVNLTALPADDVAERVKVPRLTKFRFLSRLKEIV